MTTKKTTVKEFKQELINSILNEKRAFDMRQWLVDGVDDDACTATCRTASCLAGHIEALRPRLAKKIAKELYVKDQTTLGCGYQMNDHAVIASRIWEEVTGEKCRLDFYGENYGDDDQQLTQEGLRANRKEAVSHVRGRSRKWPLLENGHGRY